MIVCRKAGGPLGESRAMFAIGNDAEEYESIGRAAYDVNYLPAAVLGLFSGVVHGKLRLDKGLSGTNVEAFRFNGRCWGLRR